MLIALQLLVVGASFGLREVTSIRVELRDEKTRKVCCMHHSL